MVCFLLVKIAHTKNVHSIISRISTSIHLAVPIEDLIWLDITYSISFHSYAWQLSSMTPKHFISIVFCQMFFKHGKLQARSEWACTLKCLCIHIYMPTQESSSALVCVYAWMSVYTCMFSSPNDHSVWKVTRPIRARKTKDCLNIFIDSSNTCCLLI